MELNLRPPSVVRAHRLAEQRPFFVMAGVCLCLAIAAFWVFNLRASSVTETASSSIDPKVNSLKGFEGQINRIRSDMRKLEENSEPYLAAIRDRQEWTSMVNEIQTRLPKDYLWITNFARLDDKPETASKSRRSSRKSKKDEEQEDTTPSKAIYRIKGLYLENPQGPSVVDQFVKNLDESPIFEVDKDPSKFTRSVPNDFEWAYDFSFPLKLKDPSAEAGDEKGKTKSKK